LTGILPSKVAQEQMAISWGLFYAEHAGRDLDFFQETNPKQQLCFSKVHPTPLSSGFHRKGVQHETAPVGETCHSICF
jgi:hypothetical protein